MRVAGFWRPLQRRRRAAVDRIGGDAYDHAMCESFFAALECELLDRHRLRSHNKAGMAVFQFIESFHNTSRRHSASAHLSPIEYERLNHELT